MEVKPFIQGKLVDLRPLSPEDATQAYADWFNDAEVCRYNSHHVLPATVASVRKYIDTVSVSGRDVVLAVVAKDTGKHIGNISLQTIDWVSRNAEYAVILGDKSYWGKGIAAEASQLVLEHGFKSLNLHRIYCYTTVNNIPMQKLAEKLGFEREGILKQAQYKDGVFEDVIAYGLLRESLPQTPTVAS